MVDKKIDENERQNQKRHSEHELHIQILESKIKAQEQKTDGLKEFFMEKFSADEKRDDDLRRFFTEKFTSIEKNINDLKNK